jgi:hypothetical protein
MSNYPILKRILWVVLFVPWVVPVWSEVDIVRVRRYTRPRDYWDNASAIAVDGFGNVYVTGSSFDSFSDHDYTIIKCNSSGNQFWVKKYNGQGNGYDVANAIVLHCSGSLNVTGQNRGTGITDNYATIKYVDFSLLQGVANSDALLNVSCIIYLVNYLFKGGALPEHLHITDSTYDCQTNVSDIIYLINYFFKRGPPLVC